MALVFISGGFDIVLRSKRVLCGRRELLKFSIAVSLSTLLIAITPSEGFAAEKYQQARCSISSSTDADCKNDRNRHAIGEARDRGPPEKPKEICEAAFAKATANLTEMLLGKSCIKYKECKGCTVVYH